MKNTFKTAFGGIITAICVVVMMMTGVISIGTYAFPCIAGILIAIMFIEFGYKWSTIVYLSVSILSILLCPDKEAMLYFVGFLGFYPIIKGLIEKIKSKILQYILKFSLFNLCMVIVFYLAIYLLSIPKESFEIFGVYLPYVFLIAGNIIFVLYDFAISAIANKYINNWQNKISKIFKF